MRSLTNVFKALSDETRLQMLDLLLREGELCVCDFVEVLDITQSKASRHLRHLVNAGLLTDRREGTWVYFGIAKEPDFAQKQLVQVLPVVFDRRLDPDLLSRLKTWKASNERAERSCAPSPKNRAQKRGGK